MSIVAPIDPSLKSTWVNYINIILTEAEESLNVPSSTPKPQSQVIENTRPHLFFVFPQLFQQPSTSMVEKIKRCLQTKAKMMRRSLEQDVDYLNGVFQLSVYHKHLIAVFKEQSQVPISSAIKEIIDTVRAIDSTRADEIWNIFYGRCFLVLGLSTLLISIGNIFKETYWMPAPWLSRIRKVCLVASLVIYGLNWLYHHGDSGKFTKSYQEIQEKVSDLKNALSAYDDAMKLSYCPSLTSEQVKDIIYEPLPQRPR